MRFHNRLNNYFHYLCPVWDEEQMTGLNVFEMCDEMNRLQVDELEKDLQWHEDVVNEFFINNQLELSEEVKQDAHLMLGIEFEYEVLDE